MNLTLFRNAAFPALIALASVAAPAVAQSAQDEAAKVVINTAGIDVASPQGQKMLHAKIMQAARLVCDNPEFSDLHTIALQRVCVDEALASAITQLTALSDRTRPTGDKLAAVDRVDRYPGRNPR